jgi:ubiquinone/menaquinone biosynthesis C-methylase UbiE
MESRKRQEAEFHDHLRDEIPFQRYTSELEDQVKGDRDWSNFKFYSIERESRAYAKEWIRARCQNKRLLDYGCGNGDDSIFAAKNGAYAVGIDISEISIANCKKKALDERVNDRTEFHVMDAEALQFEDNSFDLVVVYGVLHHMDFSVAMNEISRVLKPDGQAICTEALAHNPLIRTYRRWTPHLRTPWEVEHIMRRENIRMAENWFNRVEARCYHLATLAAVPFRRTPMFNPLLSILEVVDSALLSLPGIRWQAWQVVFELSQPRKLSVKH